MEQFTFNSNIDFAEINPTLKNIKKPYVTIADSCDHKIIAPSVEPDCNSFLEVMNRRLMKENEKMIKDNLKRSFKPEIKKVIFNDPATIVFWNDGTKTVVKKQNKDKKKKFDKEKGLAMAIAKKYFDNQGSYYNEIRKWCE